MLPDIGKISGLKFKPFNPLIAPGNVAIYDGDVNLSAAVWRNNAGGNQITFFNAPTYNAAGLNGHGTILFNGTTQYGNSTTPVINQPYTLYFVMNQVTYTPAHILDDGVTASNYSFFQIASGTELDSPPGGIFTDQININTFNIITMIFDGDFSGLRINLNNINTGIFGTNPLNGMTLSTNKLLNSFGNNKFAYIIMRNVADPTWLQNNFINWLKNRFAI